MVQLGQHAPPIHAIAHISDTHLLGGGRPLYGAVDTDAHVERALAQLDWLREQLATPAPHGTLLALHHPPIPTPVELMAIIELDHQAELAEVLRGSDVRAILAGHLHYSTSGTFAGIPVSVAAATCYTIDSSAEPGTLAGVDGGQTFNLVHVYDDQVVHSIVPLGDARRVAGFSGAFLDALAAMTPDERREAFSSKASTFQLPPLTD
jgi:3',5'-cyclic AMP phosphodiesterase CpdA